MARRADTQFAVRTEGLGQLNRSLGRIDREMRKDSLRELRDIAQKVRGRARENAPVKTGKLRQSLRYSVTNRGAAITSLAPHAGVHEYGGTISPRGTPIKIERSRYIGQGIQQEARNIEEQLGDLLGAIARRNGFR